MKLELVMLAAGNSRRFGSNKLLYTVDGQPMYRHILSELEKIQKQLESQGTQCSITVVTQYDEIAEDVRKRGISALYNLHPEEGISSSLRIGQTMRKHLYFLQQISPGFAERRFWN